MNFKRLSVEVLAVMMVLCFVELNYTHFYIEKNVSIQEFYGISVLLLLMPIYRLFLYLDSKLKATSASNPVVINIELNRFDLSWGAIESISVTPEMSIFEFLHVHPDKLQALLSHMLSKAGKSKPVLTVRPLIIVNVSVEISDLEREKLKWILFEIGAIDVTITAEDKESTAALCRPLTQ